MKAVVVALTVFFVTTAAHAQMPQQWKSPATGESERSMLNCVVQHPDSWNNVCGREATLFMDNCQGEGYSETACKRTMQEGIKILMR